MAIGAELRNRHWSSQSNARQLLDVLDDLEMQSKANAVAQQRAEPKPSGPGFAKPEFPNIGVPISESNVNSGIGIDEKGKKIASPYSYVSVNPDAGPFEMDSNSVPRHSIKYFESESESESMQLSFSSSNSNLPTNIFEVPLSSAYSFCGRLLNTKKATTWEISTMPHMHHFFEVHSPYIQYNGEDFYTMGQECFTNASESPQRLSMGVSQPAFEGLLIGSWTDIQCTPVRTLHPRGSACSPSRDTSQNICEVEDGESSSYRPASRSSIITTIRGIPHQAIKPPMTTTSQPVNSRISSDPQIPSNSTSPPNPTPDPLHEQKVEFQSPLQAHLQASRSL